MGFQNEQQKRHGHRRAGCDHLLVRQTELTVAFFRPSHFKDFVAIATCLISPFAVSNYDALWVISRRSP